MKDFRLRLLNVEILHDLNVHPILIGSKSCFLLSVFCTNVWQNRIEYYILDRIALEPEQKTCDSQSNTIANVLVCKISGVVKFAVSSYATSVL